LLRHRAGHSSRGVLCILRLRGSFILRGLRVANLQVVVDLGHASYLAGNRPGKILRALAGHRARKRHLALDRGCCNQVVLQRLRGVERVDYIHLDLPSARWPLAAGIFWLFAVS